MLHISFFLFLFSSKFEFWWVFKFTTLACPCGPCVGNVDTLRLRQNGCQFPNDIFKCIFLNENVWISIKISLKFEPNGPINNIPALVQIVAWRGPGDEPLSEPMMVDLVMHICVTRVQWVKVIPDPSFCYSHFIFVMIITLYGLLNMSSRPECWRLVWMWVDEIVLRPAWAIPWTGLPQSRCI